MTETAPGPAADATFTDPAREHAAAALRRLGHALVGHEAEPTLLERIATLAEQAALQVERGRARSRPVEAIKRRLWERQPADGEPMSHFAECVVSGSANPMGIAMRVRRAGDEALAELTLGPAFEGPPGRAHGGVVAAVFDDVMGYALVLARLPAFTGQLTVNYRAPVPLGVPLSVRAWLEGRDGRKLRLVGELTHNGQPLCDATGLFIAIPPERLGLTMPDVT